MFFAAAFTLCLNSFGICLLRIYSQMRVERFCSSLRESEEHDRVLQGCLMLSEGGKDVFYTFLASSFLSWKIFFTFLKEGLSVSSTGTRAFSPQCSHDFRQIVLLSPVQLIVQK